MPRTIRFHLDEHCSPAIARGLRRSGVDVTTAREEGLLGAQDEEHLAFATAEGRVIFTFDADFPRLHAEGVPHSEIIHGHARHYSIGEVIRKLLLYWEDYDAHDLINKLEYL